MTKKHLVEFEVEDGCIFISAIKCLSSGDAHCRTGCPVPDCDDWSHGEDGCSHCQALCDCQSECPAAEHAGACPHAFTPLGHCWLLPWLEADLDAVECCDDFRAMVYERIVQGRDEHPPETWQIEFADHSDDRGYSFWPTEPIAESLTRVAGGADQ